MSIPTLTDLGGNTSTANPATSVSRTTTVAIPAGSKVLIWTGYKPQGTTLAVTVDGNTATQIVTTTRASTPVSGWWHYFDDTAGRASGINITSSFSGTTSSGATIHCMYLTSAVTGTPTVTGSANGLSTTPSSGTSSAPTTGTDYLALAAYTAAINSATNSPANAWSSLPVQNAGARNLKADVAYQGFTADVSAQTETWTDSSAGWAGAIVLVAGTTGGGGGGDVFLPELVMAPPR